MKLLIIRHGKAEERSGLLSLKRDATRRLTKEGRKEMRKIAKGLREIAPTPNVLATSPLPRARETAEVVADVLGVGKVDEQALLAPGADKTALIAWLGRQGREATVAIVGHEPDLSGFASFAIAGAQSARLELKKGGCCLIEFENVPAAGGGTLRWLLQPGQLRKLDA
jgi:phosphohistidine phosphatase